MDILTGGRDAPLFSYFWYFDTDFEFCSLNLEPFFAVLSFLDLRGDLEALPIDFLFSLIFFVESVRDLPGLRLAIENDLAFLGCLE
jgi:hypothetical protein